MRHRTIYWAMSVVACLAFPPQSNAADRLCAISDVEGDKGVIWRNGGPQRLTKRMEVLSEDRIVTGDNTRIQINCDDGTSVTIGASTEINVGGLLEAGSERSLAARLFDGIAGFILPNLRGQRFEVRTPSAVASVRSTEWVVIVEEGATAVFVQEGRVEAIARTGGGALSVREGIDVSADGTAGPVKTWGAKRIEATKARLGFDW